MTETPRPSLLRRIVEDLRLHSVPRNAGALAFFTLFGLPALALVVLALGGAVYGDDVTRNDLLAHVEDVLGPETRSTLATVMENTPRPDEQGPTTQLLAIGALLFGAAAGFHQLQAMLNALWGARQRKGWIRWVAIAVKRLISFVMVFATSLAVIAYVGASTAIAAFPEELSIALEPETQTFVKGGLELLLSYALLTLSFLLVYKVLPDARVPWRSAILGALLAGVLFLVGRHFVEIYLSHANLASAYGGAGSLVVTLIWFYAAAFVILLGAVFSHAHAAWRAAKSTA